MLCVPIKGPSIDNATQQIEQVLPYADMVEWRLDYFQTLNIEELRHLKNMCPLPIIFTLRPPSQGGYCKLSEEDRLQEIQRLTTLKPAYFDLEYTVPLPYIQELKQKHPSIKLIISYHDFDKTPPSLEGILQDLRRIPADYYKIAVMAHSALDTVAVLLSAQEADQHTLFMTMGETGPLSRILAPVVQRPFTYASLNDEQKTAPGQISAQELRDIYHYSSLTPSTAIYGLIGQPVDKSISEYTHNNVMHQLNLNSVYVKIPVHPEELSIFIPLAKRLGIRGLSVTMPLKEHILPLLDEIDSEAQVIGAVNTIAFSSGKSVGINTDGKGALNAIEKHLPIEGKKMVLLGAGGASKAIAWEALRRKADVLILNRDETKAQALAEKLGCRWGGLEDIKGESYDLIINATASDKPIDPEYLLPQAFAMDITTKPKQTLFLQQAATRGCRLIFGYEMFVQQAIAQFKLWFPNIDAQHVATLLESSSSQVLSK